MTNVHRVLVWRAATGLLLALLAVQALATPNPAIWRRQTLVGENAEYYLRYVTTSENPPTYYSFRRTLQLERIRKIDFRVVERVSLRDATYSQDLSTGRWGERSETLPPFDLSGYLRENAVYLPFADDLERTITIDSMGVWEEFQDGRIQLANLQDLLRQIPSLGREPRVVGFERTGFRPDSGTKGYLYLRVWSNTASSDDDWSEDLFLVDMSVFR
jgi:hypothetical protein